MCVFAAFFGCKTAPAPEAPDVYYVSAGGSDRNDGLSEASAFRSLFKAVSEAAKTDIKTITVLGRLDIASEQSSNKERVFIIQGTGRELLTIRGSGGAVLSGEGADRRVVLVKGVCNIRFENIEISGGRTSMEGAGMGVGKYSEITLGPGAVVTGNQAGTVGGGIAVAPGGKVILDGGEISDNSTRGVGGGIAVVGTGSVFTMTGGVIKGNKAEGGGGVAVYENAVSNMSGGELSGNYASVAGGAVVLNRNAVLDMAGGSIRGNSTGGSGGGVTLIDHCRLNVTGGEFSGNSSGEHGGAVASDDTSAVILSGGSVRQNSAAERGGGVFSGGSFSKPDGNSAAVYGRDGGADANTAKTGRAVFAYRGGLDMIRESGAMAGTVLDSAYSGALGGWETESNEAPGLMFGPSLPTEGESEINDNGAEEEASFLDGGY
jgi:predicted outer membrane repeat protein